MRQNTSTSRTHRGLTLTELLVVVSIMVIVAGALVPMVQPVLQGQDRREAARLLSVFLASAQARAIEKGRPVGIWIERAAHEPDDPPHLWYTAYKIYQAETPPPYAGDAYNARMQLRPTNNPRQWQAVSTPQSCLSAPQLILPGDTIKFDYRGDDYRIFSRPILTGSGQTLLVFEVPDGVAVPHHYLNRWVPFQIFRQPRKIASTTLEMPNKTAIDLSLSGYGLSGTQFREAFHERDIAVMFSPQGGLDRIYYMAHEPDDVTSFDRPLGTLHLLVGNDAQVGRNVNKELNVQTRFLANIASPLGEANLQDQTNLWVSVQHGTGRVTTAPNAGFALDPGLPLAQDNDIRPFIGGDVNTDGQVDISEAAMGARRFAALGQHMGGR